MGEENAIAMLDNFLSFMTFKASPKTYEWVMEQLGHTQHLKFSTMGMGIDYQFTAKMASASPLRDPRHPDRKRFRNMIRDLRAGSVKAITDMAFSGVNAGKRRLFGGAHSASDNAALVQSATEVSPVVSGQFLQEPVASRSDLSSLLETPGFGFLKVMRGGVQRRDFVRTYRNDEWEQILVEA
jgi:hypothetical protein